VKKRKEKGGKSAPAGATTRNPHPLPSQPPSPLLPVKPVLWVSNGKRQERRKTNKHLIIVFQKGKKTHTLYSPRPQMTANTESTARQEINEGKKKKKEEKNDECALFFPSSVPLGHIFFHLSLCFAPTRKTDKQDSKESARSRGTRRKGSGEVVLLFFFFSAYHFLLTLKKEKCLFFFGFSRVSS